MFTFWLQRHILWFTGSLDTTLIQMLAEVATEEDMLRVSTVILLYVYIEYCCSVG